MHTNIMMCVCTWERPRKAHVSKRSYTRAACIAFMRACYAGLTRDLGFFSRGLDCSDAIDGHVRASLSEKGTHPLFLSNRLRAAQVEVDTVGTQVLQER